MIIQKIKSNLKNLFLLIILLTISGIAVLIEKVGFNKTSNISVAQAQTQDCWTAPPSSPIGGGDGGGGTSGDSGGGSSESSGGCGCCEG